MQTNLGDIADKILKLDDKIDAIMAKAKAAADPFNQERSGLEQQLRLGMIEAGTQSVKGKVAVALIKESDVPQIENYDALVDYVKRNNKFELFTRAISVTAWRELLETRKGKAVPGLKTFTKTALNVKKG